MLKRDKDQNMGSYAICAKHGWTDGGGNLLRREAGEDAIRDKTTN